MAATDVLKLQERLAWRRISLKQHDEYVASLKLYPGSFVRVNAVGNGDPEAETFAEDIGSVLRDAQWRVVVDRTNVMIPAPLGSNCRVDDRSAAGKALAKVLKGLPGAVITPIPLTGEIALIIVGLRPPP